jgi:hypothetical protein
MRTFPQLARLRGFDSATHHFSVSHAHQAIDFAQVDPPDLVKNGCGEDQLELSQIPNLSNT